MKYQKAIKRVKKEIEKSPNMRQAWKANIAMAFKDEFNDWCKNKVGRKKAPDYIHKISNNAAERFLDNLIK